MSKREDLKNNPELVLQIQGLISQTALTLSARVDKEITNVNAVIQSGIYHAKQYKRSTDQLLLDTQWAIR